MARNFHHSRFRWTRTGGLCALALALLLGACAASKTPPIGPWAYEFQLGTFTDQRAEDDAMMMSAVPFNIESFMQSWKTNVGRSIFMNRPAKLDITLKGYEATMNAKSYAISMDMGLRGRDMEGRNIGSMNGKCSAIVLLDANKWGDFWQQARAQGSVEPLTPAARNATMWQKVMDSCTKELAKQFGNVLATGAR